MSKQTAFTILEVLIALAASLLMMLALTRAFKLIGDKISQSQSELELSGTLRNITFSLRDELNRMTPETVSPQPRDKSTGYFTYYEGPWTDGTTTLINNTGPQTGYLPTSRFGDIDDYLAFTAKAKPGAPFVGKIPRGVLEAHRFERHIAAGGAANAFVTHDGIGIASYTLADAFALVPFYSDYAEIAYFCGPGWVRDNLGQPVYIEVTTDPRYRHPIYTDVINEVGTPTPGDDIPDRVTLHRRVLLVRPDLNMTPRRMYAVSGPALTTAVPATDEDIEQLPVLIPSNGPTPPLVRPLASQDFRFQVGPWDPTLNWAGTTTPDPSRPTWLTGLARVQQMMDLSVARITNSWSAPGGASRYGLPTDTTASVGGAAGIAANSMRSLSRPENRFAHVRMPITLSGVSASTMPLLALGPPHPLITAQEVVTTATATTADDRFGQGAGGPPYGPFTMVGFLRPEFSLTDYSVANRVAQTGVSQTYRGGADIVASDVLAFDVQVFDEDTPNFVWLGTQPGSNVPGNAGDDDGDGAIDEIDEIGLPNTDDALVSVNSPAINPLNGSAPPIFPFTTVSLPAGTSEYFVAPPGEFVDYGYTRLGGGMVGGFEVFDDPAKFSPSPTPAERLLMGRLFTTNFSGRAAASDGSNPPWSRYPTSWSDSGRFVVAGGGFAVATGAGSVSPFVQPVVDTWTESYDGDGFEQLRFPPSANVLFNVTGSTLSPPPVPPPATPPGGVWTRYWTNTVESTAAGPGFVDGSSGSSQATPPSPVMPRAVKISIRVYDRTAGEIRQQSVIQEFAR